MVTGIIGRKLGMTQAFREDGRVEAVTAIEAGPCFVTQVKRAVKDGYDAVQLGFGTAKRLNQPEKGHLGKLGLLKYLREFEASGIDAIEVGQRVDASMFEPGEVVDVAGTSKGKGFA
ncbi:MAG: large ribosomal subunit protein uL3, partial [Chloroflexota bacterium]